MTRIVAIGTDAGSAGKTTTAVTIASLLTQEGATVLLVDADSQASATHWLSTDMETNPLHLGHTLLTPSRDLAATVDAAIHTTPSGVDIIPATTSLAGDIERWRSQIGAEQRLKMAFATLGHTRYDWIIIDCPGTFFGLTMAALVASTHTWTVAKPTLKEIQGVPRWLQLVQEVAAAYNPTLACTGVIPCEVPAVNQGRLYQDALHVLQDQEWANLVTPIVRKTVCVPQSYASRTPPLDPRVRADYRAVLHHILTLTPA